MTYVTFITYMANWKPRLLVAIAVLLFAACGTEPPSEQTEHVHEATSLGTVHFDVSCSEATLTSFDEAVAMLHHMQYVEAREAFEEIIVADPSCAMAHWGVAMTLFQPLWPARPGPEDLQRGWDLVQTAQELGVATEREADLLAAAEAFYQEPETAEWWTRIGRWSEAMTTAYDARPDDIETSAFYALSHLAAGQTAENRIEYNARAASILLGIYERQPTHPGAIHYTIHANDVDERAGESLDVVRSYGEIAPSVAHALHMPTHIFVRLGSWADVIQWNERSADAALATPAGDDISHHYPHAIDYLVYAHLQRGETETARELMNEITTDGPFQGTFMSAFHLAAIPARFAAEQRDWEAAASIEPASREGVDWEAFGWAEAMSWFANGLGNARRGNMTEAEAADSRMVELRETATDAGENGFATYIEIDRRVLSAWRAFAANEADLAIERARDAVSLEATIQKHPISPGAIYPAQEALGDLFMELERFDEALEAYEASLASWPGRFNSVAGAARAANAAGLSDQAREHYRVLLEIAPNGSLDRLALVEAQEIQR